jgi:glucokinase
MLLGIDIGGTTINLGLVENNKIVRKLCVPSFRQGADLEETLVHLEDAIRQIITPEVTKIGVGVPTLVDAEKGIVYDATNIPSWTVVPLKDRLEKTFKCTVTVNNDANCFVLGAAAMLEKPSSVIVGVTLGTGTGMGIIIDGKIYNGTNCGAGELCSLPYNGGILEDFCSKKFFTSNNINPKDAGDAARKGDPHALKLMDEFGIHLGKLLSIVLFAYDPGQVVFGGGVAHNFDLFKPAMMRQLSFSYPYPRFLDKLEISAMPEGDIPVLGASLL